MSESAGGEVVIRDARREDCERIVELSREIAAFHGHHDSPQQDPKALERDFFEVKNPNMGLYLAVVDNIVVGYCHWTYTYTIRRGKCMILQDLYVQEKFRNRQIGEKLMRILAKKADQEDVPRIEFIVGDWNPAKNFYIRKGAVDVTKTDDFHFYRFDEDEIKKMALEPC